MAVSDILKKIFSKTKKLESTFTRPFDLGIEQQLYYNSEPKLSSLFNSCVFTISRQCSKFTPEVHYRGTLSTILKYKKLSYLLGNKPNFIFNAPTFWEKVVENYYNYNNAFIFIERELLTGDVLGLWNLDPKSIVVKCDKESVYYEFSINGTSYIENQENIIHISRNVGNLLDTLGKTDSSILKDIELNNANNSAIKNSIENSQAIRYLMTAAGMVDDKVKAEKEKKFNDKLKQSSNHSVVYLDQAESLKEIDTTKGKWVDSEIMSILENRIYNYFGLSNKIINGSYNEEEFQSFYESIIEPISIKLASELTNKLLTRNEYDHGAEIVVNTNKLQNASLKTRIQVARILQQSPIHRPNDILKLLYQEPIEGGDNTYLWKNYELSTGIEEEIIEDEPKPKEEPKEKESKK